MRLLRWLQWSGIATLLVASLLAGYLLGVRLAGREIGLLALVAVAVFEAFAVILVVEERRVGHVH